MIGEGKYPETICEELLGYCLAPVCQMGGLGGDNMSIIIVCFLHGKPWENLVEKCKKIHSNKKASTKLSEPAFSQFDRFTSDGPFPEVSVLKAADDVHSLPDSTSSSSHTSSPSSSPISTDEKFDAMLVEGSGSETRDQENSEKAKENPSDQQQSGDAANKEEIQEVAKSTEEQCKSSEIAEESKKIQDEVNVPTSTAPAEVSANDAIVSNGN